jgi:alpha-1,2-mannosyltransferase
LIDGRLVSRLKAGERNAVLLAAFVYAAIAVPVGIQRGGDLEVLIAEAGRWIAHRPLYADPPHVGVWWPPFAVLVVVPVALLAAASPALAKGGFALASVLCVAWTVARVPRAAWRPVVLGLAAVAVPLHRNFEDLNLNALLLALVVAAAADLDRGREARAGIWVGAATALKMFPALLLVFFAVRRRWRAAGMGLLVAVGLTISAMLPYGPAGAVTAVGDWIRTAGPSVWTLRGSNQSLAALATRLHGGTPLLAALDIGAIALAWAALRRLHGRGCGGLWRSVGVGGGRRTFSEVAVVTLLGVLLSPIAWVHYFLLLFPAWVVALHRPAVGPWRVLRPLAAVLTSGVLTVGSLSSRSAVFELSIYTWGALLLLAALAFVPAPAPEPARGSSPERA